MKRSQSIWKKQTLNITERANVFPNLQSQSHQRPHQERQIVFTPKLKATTSLKFKKLLEELQSKNLPFIMEKNLQSDTNNKIRKFLENNQNMVKNQNQNMNSNPELKNIYHSPLKEMNRKLEKHTKEPAHIKDLKSLNVFRKIMIEAL